VDWKDRGDIEVGEDLLLSYRVPVFTRWARFRATASRRSHLNLNASFDAGAEGSGGKERYLPAPKARPRFTPMKMRYGRAHGDGIDPAGKGPPK
jgi:hypothetical protein